MLDQVSHPKNVT